MMIINPPPFVERFQYKNCVQINDPVTRKRVYQTPDGESLPSVTTILSATKDMTHLNEWKKRVNEKLGELGYNPIKGGDDYFEFNEKKASELDWFYHLTGGVTHTDFFAMRPTDYSKAGEGENWDDIF